MCGHSFHQQRCLPDFDGGAYGGGAYGTGGGAGAGGDGDFGGGGYGGSGGGPVCPTCAPANAAVLELRRAQAATAEDHDEFFARMRGAPDGFSVVADFFGRGSMSSS